ncbi:MAG: hypothetical protein IPJ77_24225 [Planctomycetes bacterium]|nr:hypothetical protein [Planctomycetota bacterium]
MRALLVLAAASALVALSACDRGGRAPHANPPVASSATEAARANSSDDEAPVAHERAVQDAGADSASSVAPHGRPAAGTRAASIEPASGSARASNVVGDGASLEVARERWMHLTDAERTAILERYSEYDRLGANEKRELLQRARRLRETSQRVQSELSPSVRERLRQLQPEKRREAMREIVGGEARARGQEIRAKLPDAWLERLETARPEERLAILGQFRDRHLKRIADFAIERLGKTLGLAEEERRRLQSLPIDERAQAVLELRKRAIERDASENGLPPGMTAEDWSELVRLEPQAFFTRVQQYRQRRVESEDVERVDPDARVAPDGVDARKDDGARRGGPPVDGPEHPRAPGGPPRDGGARPANDAHPVPPSPEDVRPGAEASHERGPRLTTERREGLERLLAAVRQHADEVLDHVDLPKDERRAKLFELRRARCLEILRAYRLVSPQRMGELEALDETSFHEALRRVLQPLRREGRSPRSAPREGGDSVPGRKEGGRA